MATVEFLSSTTKCTVKLLDEDRMIDSSKMNDYLAAARQNLKAEPDTKNPFKAGWQKGKASWQENLPELQEISADLKDVWRKTDAVAGKKKNKMSKGKAIRSYMWGIISSLFGTLIFGVFGLIIFVPVMLILTICLVYRLTAD